MQMRSCGGKTTQSIPERGKGCGQASRQRQGTMVTRSRPSGVSSSSGQDLEKLVHMVARLSLNQESTLQVLRQRHGVCDVGHHDCGGQEVEGLAGDASQQHKMLARLPMREVLFLGILQQLVDLVRKDVTHLKTDPQACARDSRILPEIGTFRSGIASCKLWKWTPQGHPCPRAKCCSCWST